jgi:prefoldin alpha subunit
MENLTEEERERLQRLLAQLSDSEAAADVLRQHLSVLVNSLTELSMTIGTVKALKEVKPGTEILVPIGSDSFISAQITRSDRVTTGLGADVVAERTSDDAVALLEARAAELEQAVEQAREELVRLEERMEGLRPEAERILKKAREEPEG